MGKNGETLNDWKDAVCGGQTDAGIEVKRTGANRDDDDIG